MKAIYLDYAATTPIDPRVLSAMHSCLTLEGSFGNSFSSHDYGREAAQKIEHAREQLANLIGAETKEIIWTSGATESNNLAIQGLAHFYQKRGKHLITMKTEHKAVLDVYHFLEKQGFEVSYLSPEPDGLLNLQALKQTLRSDTILVSIMLVNNETGVIQAMKEIADMVKAHGVFLHVDAAQALSQLPIDLRTLPVDLMSFSGHKIYGPKGVGALFVRHRPSVRLQPLLYGGGQEQGLRSGTLATHQIVGMGEACAILKVEREAEVARLQSLKDYFCEALQNFPGVRVHGLSSSTSANIINVRFLGIDNDFLMSALPQCALSAASACTTLEIRPSHVLQAMGLSDQEAHESVRFSLGRYTTQQDIDEVLTMLSKIRKIIEAKKNDNYKL